MLFMIGAYAEHEWRSLDVPHGLLGKTQLHSLGGLYKICPTQRLPGAHTSWLCTVGPWLALLNILQNTFDLVL